jgi:hypothetical protein
MIETSNLRVMDVILNWVANNIKQPEPTRCPVDFEDGD